MTTERRRGADAPENEGGDRETVSGQPILEAEKNLTRNTTKDSSPPVGREEQATVPRDERGGDGD